MSCGDVGRIEYLEVGSKVMKGIAFNDPYLVLE